MSLWYKGLGIVERYPREFSILYITAHENRHKTRIKNQARFDKNHIHLTETTYKIELGNGVPFVKEGRTYYRKVKKTIIVILDFIRFVAEKLLVMSRSKSEEKEKLLRELKEEIEKRKRAIYEKLVGGVEGKSTFFSEPDKVNYAEIYSFIYQALKNPDLYLDERNFLFIPFFLDAFSSGWKFANELKEFLTKNRIEGKNLLKMIGLSSDLEKRRWSDLEDLSEDVIDSMDPLELDKNYIPYKASYSGGIENVELTDNVSEGRYRIKLLQSPQVHEIASDTFDDDLTPLGLSGTMRINGINITVNTSDTLRDIKDKIAENVDSVDALIVNKRIILRAKDPYPRRINIDGDENLLESLGFIKNVPIKKYILKHEISEPREGIIEVNGEEISSNTNNFDINGFTAEVVDDGVVDVDMDLKGILSLIRDFLEKLDKFIENLNDFLSSPAHSAKMARLLKYLMEDTSEGSDGIVKMKERTVLPEPVLVALSIVKKGLFEVFSSARFSYLKNLDIFGISRDNDGKFAIDEDAFSKEISENIAGAREEIKSLIARFRDVMEKVRDLSYFAQLDIEA